ncbi:MAG: M23 family metallopeptidase [Candidatus Altiarchaeota archaeon]
MDWGEGRRLQTVLLILAVLAPTTTSAVDKGLCERAIRLVWPVPMTGVTDSGTGLAKKGSDLAEDAIPSIFDGGDPDYHPGHDLNIPDSEQVSAVFSGTVETEVEPSDDDPGTYQKGRYITLTSTDGRFKAIYSHLLNTINTKAKDKIDVNAGDTIGRAGGGQQNDTFRGDSSGPRLYFELWDTTSNKIIDPYTCVPNTCRFWYINSGSMTREQCVPDFYNTASCEMGVDGDNYELPSYACTDDDGYSDDKYYAQVNVKKDGTLDLSCEDVDDTMYYDTKCKCEIYNEEIYPFFALNDAPKKELNCFLKFIRVYYDGTWECGAIDEDAVVYPSPLSEIPADCTHIVSLGISDQTNATNQGYTLLQQITAAKSTEIEDFVIVGSEYTILGVNDRRLIDDVISKGKDPGLTFYYTDYILARSCDLAGQTMISTDCKDKPLSLNVQQNESKNYNKRVSDGGFEECQYDLFDAGKYYDTPGLYISTFWLSRLAAMKGSTYHY